LFNGQATPGPANKSIPRRDGRCPEEERRFLKKNKGFDANVDEQKGLGKDSTREEKFLSHHLSSKRGRSWKKKARGGFYGIGALKKKEKHHKGKRKKGFAATARRNRRGWRSPGRGEQLVKE